MLSARSASMSRAHLRPSRSGASLRLTVCKSSLEDNNVGVEVPDGFRQALLEAMQRQKEQRERAMSSDSRDSSSDYDRSSWRSSDNGNGNSSTYSSWRSNGDNAGSSTSSWRSNGSSSNGSSYSSSSSGRSWRTPARPEVDNNSPATPLLQVLATALSQSRATLERLQAEEAEIENLIQKEQKQVERLEWLVGKVQQDYAYFNGIEKRFNESTARIREQDRTTDGYIDNGNGGFRW